MARSTNTPVASLGTFLDGREAEINIPQLIVSRMLIQANSGGGKSYLIRRLLEQTYGRAQQIVIDRDGEFSSLRAKFDYVIAAPKDADAVANPKTAALLARRLLETGVSAIIDIYELKKAEKQEFVHNFCQALVEAPKSLWHPLLLVIDEIHEFCPEIGSAVAASAVVDLAVLGRKRGYALIGATQRLAKLDKDVAAELLNKLVGRTGLDTDLKRATDELGMNAKEGRQILRNLIPGEFFAYGPALSSIVERLKVGAVTSQHPKVGERILFAPPKPTAAIRAVLAKLADLPKEAEAEARTVEELRQEVHSLRRELTKANQAVKPAGPAKTPPASAELIRAAEERGAREAMTANKKHLERTKKVLRTALTTAVDEALVNAWTQLTQGLSDAPKPSLRAPQVLPASITRLSTVRAAAAPQAPHLSRQSLDQTEDGSVSGPEQRILNAIGWLQTMTGEADVPQTAAAFLAGYTYNAGSFNNPKARLNVRRLVQYVPGKKIRLTQEGRHLAQIPDTPLTVEELHQKVLAQLPGPEQRILKPLLKSYPDPMEGPAVAEAANYVYNAGSFNNPRSRLRSWGLIEYVGNKQLVASSCLFRD